MTGSTGTMAKPSSGAAQMTKGQIDMVAAMGLTFVPKATRDDE
jgi:hypothetical protein